MEEELDESLFFLEMIVEFNECIKGKIAILYKEGEEILKIIVSTINTLRNKVKQLNIRTSNIARRTLKLN